MDRKSSNLLPSYDVNNLTIVRMEDGISCQNIVSPQKQNGYRAYGLVGNTSDERIPKEEFYPWNGTCCEIP